MSAVHTPHALVTLAEVVVVLLATAVLIVTAFLIGAKSA